MNNIFVGLGSNLGNRKENIKKAIEKMSECIQILNVSRLYRTKPQENVQGGWFLNGVLHGRTSLTPIELLRFLQSIENQLGRPGNHKKNTARTIDLDILFFGKKIIKNKFLRIPHPKIAERSFVLDGLSEIASGFVHPETKKTVSQMLKEYRDGNIKNKKRNSCSREKSKRI